MKHRLIFLTLFAALANFLPAAPSIKIGTLVLFRTTPPNGSPAGLREYLQLGDSHEHWNRLALVQVFKDLTDPKTYLESEATAVTKSNPYARYYFFHDEKTNDLLLDFITFSPESAAEKFAEWNLVRAKFVPGTGLIVYQYAMRLYQLDENIGTLITAERTKMAGPFNEASFEELK